MNQNNEVNSGLLESFKKKLNEILYEKNFFTECLALVEIKSGLKRTNIALGLIGVLAIYLMIGYGSDFLCNLIGFAYPAYQSIKAIESRDQMDDTKWLIYWVVYSVFLLCEYFTDIILSWIPFYWFFKCIFLIYCMLPEPYSGSLLIYNYLLRPFFLKHHETIDRGVEQVAAIGKGLADGATKVVSEDGSKTHTD